MKKKNVEKITKTRCQGNSFATGLRTSVKTGLVFAYSIINEVYPILPGNLTV